MNSYTGAGLRKTARKSLKTWGCLVNERRGPGFWDQPPSWRADAPFERRTIKTLLRV